TAAAAQVIDGFRAMARRPEEIEICFGVTLDGKLGGVIASANAGAHLDVKLRWHGSAAQLDGNAQLEDGNAQLEDGTKPSGSA
ncbi:MAG TPA: CU044_2847 family protein, partial [Streptosporangiaceae bacterium]|nr:CU044_2847 family protein [Streptosporangiaceae bacterium]